MDRERPFRVRQRAVVRSTDSGNSYKLVYLIGKGETPLRRGRGVALLRNSRSRRTGPRSSSASVHALRSWHSKLRHPVQHSALDRGFDFLVLDRAGREAYPEYRLVP